MCHTFARFLDGEVLKNVHTPNVTPIPYYKSTSKAYFCLPKQSRVFNPWRCIKRMFESIFRRKEDYLILIVQPMVQLFHKFKTLSVYKVRVRIVIFKGENMFPKETKIQPVRKWEENQIFSTIIPKCNSNLFVGKKEKNAFNTFQRKYAHLAILVGNMRWFPLPSFSQRKKTSGSYLKRDSFITNLCFFYCTLKWRLTY